jgi:copper transport protein
MGLLTASLGRRTRWLLACCVASIAALVAMQPSFAYAANPLVSSDPANGATVDKAVRSVSLTFTSPLGQSGNTMSASCNSVPITLAPPEVAPDGITLQASVVDPMPNGTCNVSFLVVDTNGAQAEANTITFTVAIEDNPAGDGAAATPDTVADGDATAQTVPVAAQGERADVGGATTPIAVAGPLGLGRLVGILGLCALFGGIALIVLTWTDGVDYVLTLRFLQGAWGVALAGSYINVAGLAAQSSGAASIFSGLSPGSWGALTDSNAGLAALARLGLVVASILVVQRPERAVDEATRLAAVAMPGIAVATLGLSRDGGSLVAVGYLAGVVHALSMAVWLGGIMMLAYVVLAGPGDDDLVGAVLGFGKVANVAVVATVASGVVQLIRLDGGDLLGSGHGRIMVLKALAVGAMVVVGMAARQAALSRLLDADHITASLALRLRRAVTMEVMIGAFTVLLTAWAMSYQPPKVDATIDAISVGTSVRLENPQYIVDVAITQKVGPNALVVTVRKADAAITQLVVSFEPPPGATIGGVQQPIPLTTVGLSAVLAKADGLPLDAEGVWQIVVSIGGIEIDRESVDIRK